LAHKCHLVKSLHLHTATYRETLTRSGLQFEVAYWLAMKLVMQHN